MSESEKKASDPFAGLDWDQELDDWDKRAAKDGTASVPAAFVNATSEPAKEDPSKEPAGSAPPQKAATRPLYRPPTPRAAPTPSTNVPTRPLPVIDDPNKHPTRPPPASELPSLIDDEQEVTTKDGQGSHQHDDVEEDDGRTVIGAVPQNLLAQLQAASAARVPRVSKEPKIDASRASEDNSNTIDIDLGLDEAGEKTADHFGLNTEDVSVVTSAPDFVSKVRGPGKVVEPPQRTAEAPVADGELFDPFKDLSLEPPASKAVSPSSHPAAKTLDSKPPAGPRLLAPDERRHSDSDVTAILDKRQVFQSFGELLDPSRTRPTPQQSKPSVTSRPPAEADPFAPAEVVESPDPFSGDRATFEPGLALDDMASDVTDDVDTDAVQVDELELAGQADVEVPEPQGSSFDLLHETGDSLPSLAPPSGGRSAADLLGDKAAPFRRRAERTAEEARSHQDKTRTTHGLVVASELAAIAGDRIYALELAEEAWNLAPNNVLAIRQLRQLYALDMRWDEVAPLLDSEVKSSAPAIMRGHAALLAGDVARLVRDADDDAAKYFEQAQGLLATDVRPQLVRAARAIADRKTLPTLRFGEGDTPLGDALQRRAKHGEPTEDLTLSTFTEGLAKFAAEEVAVDGQFSAALEELAGSPSFGVGARWVQIALDSVRALGRVRALESLSKLEPCRAVTEASLCVALDRGDARAAREAASILIDDANTSHAHVARIAVAVLSGNTSGTAIAGLEEYAAVAGVAAFARGACLSVGVDGPDVFAATDGLDAEARASRRFVEGKPVDGALQGRLSDAAGAGFALSDALAHGSPPNVLAALSQLVTFPADSPADEPLVRCIAEIAVQDFEAAKDQARAAAAADASCFAAVDALLQLGAEGAEEQALIACEATPDEERGGLLAIGLGIGALRRGNTDLAKRAAEIAMTRLPNEPLSAFVAELRGRKAADLDAVVLAVRARAHANTDPVAKAGHLVREILLLLGSDLATCIERATEAITLLPHDPSLRALYERLAGEGAQGRAVYRADLSERVDGPAKAELLLDAAREAERHGDLEASEKYAFAAEAAGAAEEATALRHRVQARGDGAARLAEELLEAAKKTENLAAQREAYEALAELDLFARKDAASAILWHRSILEGTPSHLPSLRRLEQMLLSEGREDDYESVASDLATALPIEARDAHAEVAARLRLRRPGTPWESIADLIQAATERDVPSLWASRAFDALSRFTHDEKSTLRAAKLLLARTDRPAEVATLCTRAAECAFRNGDANEASMLLDRALQLDPQHPTALASLAELRRAEGDMRGAAEAVEAMAQAAGVEAHRLEEWHAAGLLWIDEVKDRVRGRNALEHAAEIDFGYADVFERLVNLARDGKELEVVDDLYGRRLAQTENVDDRAALHVEHAQVLVELGDRDGARRSLSSALEAAPNHVGALEEASRLAELAEDWSELERHLRAWSDLAPSDEAKLAAHVRLAKLYESEVPNPELAEASLRKLLEANENDDDILARLVKVYVSLGDAEQAVETHKSRVRVASTLGDPAIKRNRFIELSVLLDEVANDPERALKALEQARGIDPADLESLTALASFHTKHGQPELVAPALDGAALELRKKLRVSPGDEGLLTSLEKVLEIRGLKDAVRMVGSVRASLSGQPSPLIGAEDGASLPELDELLCPPVITNELRAFLTKAAEVIEKSIQVDLRGLKATKLGTNNPVLKAKIDAVAHGFGMPDPDVVISRAQPMLAMPVGSKPFQIVIGEGLIATTDEDTRRYALARVIKLAAAHCSILVRVPVADLQVHVDALLAHLHPGHPAPTMEPEKLDELQKRMQRFVPRKDEAELKALATTLCEAGVGSFEELAKSAQIWSHRVGLIAIGDLGAALRGIAWSLGEKELPSDPATLRAWIAQHEMASELLDFALSPSHLEARIRAGVGHS